MNGATPSHPSSLVAFAAWFGVTLVLLAIVAWSGFRAKRRIHVPAVVLLVASLVVTIVEAKRLGREVDLHAAGVITPIHLTLAKLTTAALLGPLVTGVLTWRDARHRPLHRKLALVALALTVVSAITGTIMIALAPTIGSQP